MYGQNNCFKRSRLHVKHQAMRQGLWKLRIWNCDYGFQMLYLSWIKIFNVFDLNILKTNYIAVVSFTYNLIFFSYTAFTYIVFV